MSETTLTRTGNDDSDSFEPPPRLSALLVACAPQRATTVDRLAVDGRVVVGRDAGCDLQVRDSKVSGRHFRISRSESRVDVEDLGSTNGTFVNGLPVSGRTALAPRSLIRAGRALFVYHDDAGALMRPAPTQRHGMAGRFHVGPLLRELREAARSMRPVLLAGETGSGKELAAAALARMMGGESGPLALHTFNAARYASREEATANLFGVSAKSFSGVDARTGLIEQTDGGALFIDEVHNLPDDLQRALLRVMDDGQFSRLGETRPRQAYVRFVLATNASGSTKGLVADLYNRLRTVDVPPLAERIADIPSIFVELLRAALDRQSAIPDDVLQLVSGDHFEALCLDEYGGQNVRGLIDLADRVSTRVAESAAPDSSLGEVFGERFGDGLVARRRHGGGAESGPSRYERNRALIVATYEECDRNLSETERRLKMMGLRCSRRWLAVFLEKWGVKASTSTPPLGSG